MQKDQTDPQELRLSLLLLVPGTLRWPVELPDFGAAPVEDRRRIRKVDVCISLCGDGVDISFLFFCELHRLSVFFSSRNVRTHTFISVAPAKTGSAPTYFTNGFSSDVRAGRMIVWFPSTTNSARSPVFSPSLFRISRGTVIWPLPLMMLERVTLLSPPTVKDSTIYVDRPLPASLRAEPGISPKLAPTPPPQTQSPPATTLPHSVPYPSTRPSPDRS